MKLTLAQKSFVVALVIWVCVFIYWLTVFNTYCKDHMKTVYSNGYTAGYIQAVKDSNKD